MQGEVFRRRRLPHWDVPGAIYFVTSCLEGSIPAQGLLDIAGYRSGLEKRQRSTDVTPDNWKRQQGKLLFARTDQWLDRGSGVRHLERTDLANLVVESIKHFAGVRYDLFSFVVMPSHFHWVFRPREDWIATLNDMTQVADLPEPESGRRPAPRKKVRTPRERIMHTLKLHTALECNRLLGREGTFWQDESYDHCVLDEEELGRVIQYVERNPVQAGLCTLEIDWAYSSARERQTLGIPYSEPLPCGAGCQPAARR